MCGCGSVADLQLSMEMLLKQMMMWHWRFADLGTVQLNHHIDQPVNPRLWHFGSDTRAQ